MIPHIPNLLTLFRVTLIPVLVVAYFLPFAWRAEALAGIFVLAALTDWLDGFLARRMNATSALGAFLDPVADKLVVSTALVLLVSDTAVLAKVLHATPFALAVAVIIGREIVVSALREWMSELGERGAVAVGAVGKYKTVCQMAAIGLLLYGEDVTLPYAERLYPLPVFLAGEILLYLAALLTLWSMLEYLRAALPHVLEKS